MAPLRIVVVDDDLAILDMTELLLALEGYEPRGCLSVATALALVFEHLPALAIIDLHLEQPAAGLALAATLRHDARTAHLPILVWSADPQVAITVAHAHLEGVAVRTKPVLAAELLALVNQLVYPTRAAQAPDLGPANAGDGWDRAAGAPARGRPRS